MKIPNILIENYKEIIIQIVMYIILLAVIIYLKPSTIILISILFVFSMVMYLYNKLKKNELKFKDTIFFIIKMYISLLVIIYTIKWLGAYGIIGFIIIVLAISGYRLIKGKKFYMQGIREIETMIFGKSLDKENWQKGELKNGSKH